MPDIATFHAPTIGSLPFDSSPVSGLLSTNVTQQVFMACYALTATVLFKDLPQTEPVPLTPYWTTSDSTVLNVTSFDSTWIPLSFDCDEGSNVFSFASPLVNDLRRVLFVSPDAPISASLNRRSLVDGSVSSSRVIIPGNEMCFRIPSMESRFEYSISPSSTNIGSLWILELGKLIDTFPRSHLSKIVRPARWHCHIFGTAVQSHWTS